MIYILTILGGLLSVAAMGEEAILFGLLCGYLLGALLRQKRRLNELDHQLLELRSRLPAQASATTTATDTATTTRSAEEAAGSESSGGPDADIQPVEQARRPQPSAWEESTTGDGFSMPGLGRLDGLTSGLLGRVRDYFSGGNLIVRVGVIVLFFGVAFLLKYAAEHSQLPMELRLAGVALGGMLMLVFGWRLRRQRESYALALQGGAVGVLYLTVFAALRLYALLPPTLAFGLLLVFVGLAALLALLQDSRILAVLGTAGGFLAPVLTSTGEGSHVALFGYYLLLNGGVLAIAWFRAWRLLNLVGFGFTFVIASLWGMRYYRPGFFDTTEPFLVAFFLMYVAIAVLFALRQPPKLKGLVDGTLVFGVPLATAALQAALVKDSQYGLAISALALGGFYILLAGWLYRRSGDSLRMLVESFLATGVVFATLAVPFALEGRLTSAFWALEGAAVIWVGFRQGRLLPRLFGALLQILAGLLYLEDSWRGAWELPILNSHLLGAALIAFAGLFTAFYRDRHPQQAHRLERWLAPLFFAWGMAWWLGGMIQEIEHFVRHPNQWAWLLAGLAATAFIAEVLRARLDWQRLRWVSLGLLPLLLLAALLQGFDQSHPMREWNGLGWLLALSAHYWVLRNYDEFKAEGPALWHAGSFWLASYLLTAEAAWRVDQWVSGAAIWGHIAWAVIPVVMLLLLFTQGRRLAWPVMRFPRVYHTLAVAPVAAYLLVWALWINATSNGAAWPLEYLPLLNPLDVTILLVLLCLVKWWQMAEAWLAERGLGQLACFGMLGGAIFLWLNGVTARSVHHWVGVRYALDPLFHSQEFQASIAVLWSVIGLGAMVAGTRSGRRALWLTGAVLMGLVVVKLFAIDLSNTGTVARIVSFIGVGLILLVVGYFSPAPPRREVTVGEKEAQV